MRQDVCNNERHGLTWEQLVAAEPRLASLLEEVWAARPDDGDEYELEGLWGQSKDRIAGLVDWHRRYGKPLLQTEAAYRTIPFNMGNRQKHGLFEKNRGRELRKTEPDCKKPRKIGHSCMLRGLAYRTAYNTLLDALHGDLD